MYNKRMFDKALAGLLLGVFGLPIQGMAYVMSRVTGSSSGFYEATRLGYKAQPFTMLKIRTMRELKPGENASVNDRTPLLGKILRKTHLDELPQLVNVWRGEMSFVGPRPITKGEPVLSEHWGRAAKRFEVLPGLTGLAQLENMKNITQEQSLELDLKYVANITFSGDAKIIAKTPFCIIKNLKVPHYVPVIAA